MFALRHIQTQKFCRTQTVMGRVNLVSDCDLKNAVNLVLLPDLWTATQFLAAHLKKMDAGQIEIVELEIREVRVIPPVMNVKAKQDEVPGNQLPITPIVRP